MQPNVQVTASAQGRRQTYATHQAAFDLSDSRLPESDGQTSPSTVARARRSGGLAAAPYTGDMSTAGASRTDGMRPPRSTVSHARRGGELPAVPYTGDISIEGASRADAPVWFVDPRQEDDGPQPVITFARDGLSTWKPSSLGNRQLSLSKLHMGKTLEDANPAGLFAWEMRELQSPGGAKFPSMTADLDVRPWPNRVSVSRSSDSHIRVEPYPAYDLARAALEAYGHVVPPTIAGLADEANLFDVLPELAQHVASSSTACSALGWQCNKIILRGAYAVDLATEGTPLAHDAWQSQKLILSHMTQSGSPTWTTIPLRGKQTRRVDNLLVVHDTLAELQPRWLGYDLYSEPSPGNFREFPMAPNCCPR